MMQETPYKATFVHQPTLQVIVLVKFLAGNMHKEHLGSNAVVAWDCCLTFNVTVHDTISNRA